MARSREKVQQLGFWDEEVSKPDHDAVCLWAYQNAESIFRAVSPELFDRGWNECDPGFQSIQDSAAIRAFIADNPRPNPKVSKRTLECVLRSYTGYNEQTVRIVGFADLMLETIVPSVAKRYIADPSGHGDDVFDGYELGWSDGPYRTSRILVEAKSVLPTVGELMRQIQLYRTAFSGKVVVVAPDDRYAEILEEQGVTFVKYES